MKNYRVRQKEKKAFKKRIFTKLKVIRTIKQQGMNKRI